MIEKEGILRILELTLLYFIIIMVSYVVFGEFNCCYDGTVN